MTFLVPVKKRLVSLLDTDRISGVDTQSSDVSSKVVILILSIIAENGKIFFAEMSMAIQI